MNIKAQTLSTDLPYANRKVFELIQEETNGNVKAFAKKINVSQQSLNRIFCIDKRNGKYPSISNEIKQGIIDAYGKDEIWFITDKTNPIIYGEDEIKGEPAKPGGKAIPFYDADSTGGYEGRVSDSNLDAPLAGYIQPGGWFDGRETAAIRHVGDSMAEYPNGCILAVREVTERRLLVPGKNYVVETTEYRVTKRVQRGSTPNSIALYSTNKEKYEDGRLVYEPFEVELSDIRRIFSVLGYIVNQSGEYKLINPQ